MSVENQTTQPENQTDGATLMGGPAPEPSTEGANQVVDGQQSTETQDQQAAESASTEDKPAKDAVPEKYEFTAPEGKEFDPSVITSFSEAAKKANLSQENAQGILDMMAPKLAERQVQHFEKIKADWTAQAKADKEFGGEKISENLGVAKKALEQFGSPELGVLLEESGIGNHPEVIRFFYRAGKAISEDSYVGGTKSSGGVKDPAKILYPDMA